MKRNGLYCIFFFVAFTANTWPVSTSTVDYTLSITAKTSSSITVEVSMVDSNAEITAISQISCNDESTQTPCSDTAASTNIVSPSSTGSITFEPVTPGRPLTLSVSSVTYSLGASSTENTETKSVSLCTDPVEGIDWYSQSDLYGGDLELPLSASNYNIDLVPTQCTGTLSLEHYEDWDPEIYDLLSGCEYYIHYASRCIDHSGSESTSDYVVFPTSFCTKPATPSSGVILEEISDTTARISGFSVANNGNYDHMEVDFLTGCVEGTVHKTFQINESEVSVDGLLPGCSYTLRYKSVCSADSGDLESTSKQSSFNGQFCTTPREIDDSTLTHQSDHTSITFLGSTEEVMAVEGNLFEYKVKSISPNEGSNNGPTPGNANLVVSSLTPGTQYVLELENMNSCDDVSVVAVSKSICTGPSPPDPESLTTDVTISSITIKGSSTPIQASSGNLEKYEVVSVQPDGGSNPGAKLKNEDLIISGLVPGTAYTLGVSSVIECSGTQRSETTPISQCTVPETPSDSVSIVANGGTGVSVSGFAVPSGLFTEVEIDLISDCFRPGGKRTLTTSSSVATFSDVPQDCDNFTVSYKVICTASANRVESAMLRTSAFFDRGTSIENEEEENNQSTSNLASQEESNEGESNGGLSAVAIVFIVLGSVVTVGTTAIVSIRVFYYLKPQKPDPTEFIINDSTGQHQQSSANNRPVTRNTQRYNERMNSISNITTIIDQ